MCEIVFTRPIFHEVLVRLPKPVDEVLEILAKSQIQGGFALKKAYPELGEVLVNLCN